MRKKKEVEEREFQYDKERTLAIENKFDTVTVAKFMKDNKINEADARHILAEKFFDQSENEMIAKVMRERDNKDIGVRVPFKDIFNRIDEIKKNKKKGRK